MDLLLPVPADRRPARAALLLGGLVLYGVSCSMMLLGGLGQQPWSTLDQGLSRTVGLQVGTWSILVGALVLALWWPLGLRPGVGTLSNVVVVGSTVDVVMSLVDAPQGLPVRVALTVGGIVVNAVATGAYIGAGLGPGPRDGLALGLAARGLPLHAVRAVVEVTVLGVGWALGGDVGMGTVLYAVAIGPMIHVTVPALRLRGAAERDAGAGAVAATTRS